MFLSSSVCCSLLFIVSGCEHSALQATSIISGHRAWKQHDQLIESLQKCVSCRCHCHKHNSRMQKNIFCLRSSSFYLLSFLIENFLSNLNIPQVFTYFISLAVVRVFYSIFLYLFYSTRNEQQQAMQICAMFVQRQKKAHRKYLCRAYPVRNYDLRYRAEAHR